MAKIEWGNVQWGANMYSMWGGYPMWTITTYANVIFDSTPTGRAQYGASTSSDDNVMTFDATPTGRARE